MYIYICTDYSENEWPDSLEEPTLRQSTRSEPGTLKKFLDRNKTELSVFNMSAIMAAVGAGFDIRFPGRKTIHRPNPPSRDRTSRCSEPAASRFDSTAGPNNLLMFNNTYHGQVACRQRSSIDFEALSPSPVTPLNQQYNGYRSADSLASTTQSSDDIFSAAATPSLTSCTSSGDHGIYDSSLSTSIDSEAGGGNCEGRCKHKRPSASSSPALLEGTMVTTAATRRSSNPRTLRRSRDSRRLRLGLRTDNIAVKSSSSTPDKSVIDVVVIDNQFINLLTVSIDF